MKSFEGEQVKEAVWREACECTVAYAALPVSVNDRQWLTRIRIENPGRFERTSINMVRAALDELAGEGIMQTTVRKGKRTEFGLPPVWTRCVTGLERAGIDVKLVIPTPDPEYGLRFHFLTFAQLDWSDDTTLRVFKGVYATVVRRDDDCAKPPYLYGPVTVMDRERACEPFYPTLDITKP